MDVPAALGGVDMERAGGSVAESGATKVVSMAGADMGGSQSGGAAGVGTEMVASECLELGAARGMGSSSGRSDRAGGWARSPGGGGGG